MDSVISNIERLVGELYAENGAVSNDRNSFDEINRLLTNAQNSKEAWSFVWPLLKHDKSTNVQYFGASTLYIKLSKFFYELDQESQAHVRQQIVDNLILYLNYPHLNFITAKLISCLAAYVIQTIDSNWQTALQDIVGFIQPEKLSYLPPTRVIFTLLQILNYIPEELNKIYLDKNKKINVRSELQKHAESVIFIVHKVLSEENISDTLTKEAVQLFATWSKGLDTLVLSESHSNIMASVLNAVCNENTCSEAVECIVDIYTSPHMEKHPKLILQLIEQMSLGLESLIHKALIESNNEFLKNLYTLFISIGEVHTRLLLDSIIDYPTYTNVIIKLLQIILNCSSTPNFYGYDESISNLPFNFWITLQDDIMGSDEGKLQRYLVLFKDIFLSLIDTLIVKVQYPPDDIYIQEWDNEDREKFRCYRQDIGDTFVYCFNILQNSMLQKLIEHFNKALNQMVITASKNSDSQTLSSSARYLEAVLFASSSITENIFSNENFFMPQIFSSFQTIPLDRLHEPRLLATLMNFLSASSEWLACNPNYIEYTLTVIATALKSNNQLVVVSASMALKIITPECQMCLHPYATQIVSLCEEHLNYPTLQYKDRARLMYSLGTVLSIMPIDIIMQTIERVLVPILSETEKMLCVDRNNNPDARIHIGGVLLILANLFANLDINLKGTQLEEGDQLVAKSIVEKSAKNSIKPQPLYLIMEKVLPLFGVIGSNYADDEEIAENLCECIKKSVITLLDDIKPLLGNIVQLLLHLYQASKPVCVLKISRQLFILFYKSPDILPHLQEYYHSLCQITIGEFKNNFRESTCLAQTFYEESALILKKSTVILTYSKLDLASIYNFAISGILLPEKSTIHQCAVFISEFLSHGRNNDHFHNVINERFDALVMQIFTVIGGQCSSPSYALEYMADIIIALNQKYSDSFSRALNALIDTEGFPTSFVTRDNKVNFVKNIITLRNNKRKLKDVIKEFSARCRGLYGVDKKN